MKYSVCLLGVVLLVIVFLDATTAATQAKRQLGGMPFRLPFRMRRLHHRSAMFGDYYPEIDPQMMFVPAMTSFSSGDTVSTEYLTPDASHRCRTCEEQPALEETTEVHIAEVTPNEIPEEEVVISTSSRVPVLEESSTHSIKTDILPPKKNNPVEDDEDEDVWPRGAVPSYNVFFPMMIGYPGYGGRSGQEEGGHPGGATAIANSFSSGKGGVATSHATAFGNAPPVKHSYWKRKPQSDD